MDSLNSITVVRRFLTVSPTRALQGSLCQSPGSLNTATMSRKFLGSSVHIGFLRRHAHPRKRGMCLSSPKVLLFVPILQFRLFGGYCSLYYRAPSEDPLSLTAPSPQPTVPLPLFGEKFCPSSFLLVMGSEQLWQLCLSRFLTVPLC